MWTRYLPPIVVVVAFVVAGCAPTNSVVNQEAAVFTYSGENIRVSLVRAFARAGYEIAVDDAEAGMITTKPKIMTGDEMPRVARALAIGNTANNRLEANVFYSSTTAEVRLVMTAESNVTLREPIPNTNHAAYKYLDPFLAAEGLVR